MNVMTLLMDKKYSSEYLYVTPEDVLNDTIKYRNFIFI